MSNPISVSSLKKLILKSNDPKAKIELLLKTLPYTIQQEEKRSETFYSKDVIKGLKKKLKMVEGLAKDIQQEEYGIWSDFAEEGLAEDFGDELEAEAEIQMQLDQDAKEGR